MTHVTSHTMSDKPTAASFADKWPRRRLGRTGLMVPPLALGGAGIGGVYGEVSDAQAIECIHCALEQGLNFMDTDASYGQSERRLGLALRGVPRASYILSTKCGTHPERGRDFSRDGTLWNVENSLRVLGTDYLDVLLVHDPPDMECVMEDGGAFDALEELKAQGVIGHIGLGQRRHDFHAQAIESGRVDVILTYNDYNPIRTTSNAYLLDLAAGHDVGVINGSPLAMGLLAGADPDESAQAARFARQQRELEAARRLYHWCEARGVPETAVVFQFCLREPRIHATITGVKTRSELEDDIRSALAPLPPALWEELAALHLTAGQEQPKEFCVLTEEEK